MKNQPVIIVTGASRGIGAAVALWLATAGSTVVLVARHAGRLARMARQVDRLGGRAFPIAKDISQAIECLEVVGATRQQFGRIDALINNAGVIDPLAPVAEVEPQDWQDSMMINLLGPFFMSRFALSALREQRGRIVNVSSGAARHPIAGASAYCAAKAGLTHFSRVLAAEEPEITVMAIRPGVVDTEMQSILRERGASVMPPAEAAYYAALKQDGKLEPAWVPARTIAWMALAAPRSLSGQFLDYDDPRLVKPAGEMLGKAPPF